jgi:hypothetical protein
MAETETRLQRAQEYHIVRDDAGQPDLFVWEHVRRVAHCSLILAHLPELSQHQIDLDALEVAALFHDAGWIAQYRQGYHPRLALLGRPTSDLQRDLAVSVIAEVLGGSESPGTLDRAARMLRACNSPNPVDPAAQLLIEAERFDEIGPLALLRQWRRFVAEGKAVSDLIKTWSQQQEYHFWEARLHDFRFDFTRDLARRRLESNEPFMRVLNEHHCGQDIMQAFEASGARTGQQPLPASLTNLHWPGVTL